ncbi:hypothetical protein YP76_06920 [Sphingobium chungbukense]|uniref:Uncharacterized protein n=1 Tax=Sphingobium chungbukense TaxID=56193 RepID=A0A0M3AS26_9SPHN|nr:hypothetical protein YP76_06920 [Sphingobium chungbukense]
MSHNLPNSNETSTADMLADLARAKALFQMRAIAAVLGAPAIIRDVDGDGLMLTVEPLQFLRVVEGSADRADPPSGSVRAVCFESVSHEGASA